MKYAALLNNGDRKHDNNSTNRNGLPKDSRRGPNRALDYKGNFPSIAELGMDFKATPTFPNQMKNVVILTKTPQIKSAAARTSTAEKFCQVGNRHDSNMSVHMIDVDDQRQSQHQHRKLIGQCRSSKDDEMNQLRQKAQHAHAIREKGEMEHEMNELRYQLAQREKEMGNETTKLREELRKQKKLIGEYRSSKDDEINQLRQKAQHAIRETGEMEHEMNELRYQLAQREKEMGNETTKLRQKMEVMAQEYETKVESDLEAYKRKCSAYREQLLQKEKENAKVEQALYNERKKVLSLEHENETLINVAEEKVGNVMTSERVKSSELKRYKDQCEKYRNESAKMEQALYNERKRVSALESENEMLTKVAEEKVGNAITSEKAKSSVLKSYVDQCEKYRERVLGLERKVMSMESALNATSSIASTLDVEKKAISSELSQAKAKNATFDSEISDKDAVISSLRSDVSSLQSKCSRLEAALKGVESKAKLENENASLEDQLKEQSVVIEKLQTSVAKYTQIEDEIASLKRKNDELTAKELQMKEELSKSEVFSSNTERLRKMLSDSESFISSLQSDLSSARTSHHQQLTDARAKYSSEIDCITAQLETQIAAKRELEVKNNNLEDKVLSLQRNLFEIEDQGTHQTKAQSEQLLKMTEHADILRKKLSESGKEVSSMKRELDTNERTAAELRNKIQTLEDEKLGMSENVKALEGELQDFTTEKTNQIKELQHCIKERDDALAKHERIISSETTQKLQQIEELKHLKGKLKVSDEVNKLLRDEMRGLSERKENEINELKRAFDFDRKAQDASIESLIASKEEELQSMRIANEGLKGQIEKLSEEAAQLQRRSARCESELKDCQAKLSAAQEENGNLKETARAYQDKTNNLTGHYMKIEDEIRTQLNKARTEKDTAEKKLAADKKETDRLMDEFYSQKQELTSRVMELTDQLDTISKEKDILHRQEEVLKSTIAEKEKETKELQECVDTMKDQLQCVRKEVTEKAEQQSLQNTSLLQHTSQTSKVKFKLQLKPILLDVEDSVDAEADVENEANATPSNHKKKKGKNRKASFQFNESPRDARAKGNAVLALGSPRAPLTPRRSHTQLNFNGWITPRTPRALAIDDKAKALASLGFSKSEETVESLMRLPKSEDSESEELWEPAAWLYIT
eukprot:scaffold11779_cov134-Skeletonema_dohrnii-CCMP3373.AAC.2